MSKPLQTGTKLEALLAVQRELKKWNSLFESGIGYVMEDVPPGHSLHSAVAALQQFYDRGRLPRPALRYWRTFLKFARRKDDEADDDQAEDEAEKLLDWVTDEIKNQSDKATGSQNGDTGTKRRGRRKADYETVQREAEIADRWKKARECGVCKVDFAHDEGTTLKKLQQLLDRDRKRQICLENQIGKWRKFSERKTSPRFLRQNSASRCKTFGITSRIKSFFQTSYSIIPV